MTKQKVPTKANLRTEDLKTLQLIQMMEGHRNFSVLIDRLVQTSEVPQSVLALSVTEKKGVTLHPRTIERLNLISGKTEATPPLPEAFRILVKEYCRTHKIKLKFTDLSVFSLDQAVKPALSLSLMLLPSFQEVKAWASTNQAVWEDEGWTSADQEQFELIQAQGSSVKLAKLDQHPCWPVLQDRFEQLGLTSRSLGPLWISN